MVSQGGISSEVSQADGDRPPDLGVVGVPWVRYGRQHSEFRQDRFLTAVDWQSDQPFKLAYVVRAVSPGSFHHPAASVEDMYRPDLTGRSETGRVIIAE